MFYYRQLADTENNLTAPKFKIKEIGTLDY
jgi:hypothetical protein